MAAKAPPAGARPGYARDRKPAELKRFPSEKAAPSTPRLPDLPAKGPPLPGPAMETPVSLAAVVKARKPKR